MIGPIAVVTCLSLSLLTAIQYTHDGDIRWRTTALWLYSAAVVTGAACVITAVR